MERQVGQMVRLVDDLLDVARITTGKIDLRCEPFDLAMAIRDAVETSAPELGLPGPTVDGDRAAAAGLRQRRSHAARAGVRQPAEQQREVQRAGPADFDRVRAATAITAVIRVRDAGIGIHPEMLPRVFDMFRQADRTGGRSRGGLGIGLSLVKRIVELHDGTVTAHSDGPGTGQRVRGPDPVDRATRIASAEQAGAVRGRTASRRKILVVDDNEDAAESLAALLSISGHETRMAHDGPEAP